MNIIKKYSIGNKKAESFYQFARKKCGNNANISVADIDLFIELVSQIETTQNYNDIPKIMDKYRDREDMLVLTLFCDWVHFLGTNIEAKRLDIEKAQNEIKVIEKRRYELVAKEKVIQEEKYELTIRENIFKQFIHEQKCNDMIRAKQKDVLNTLSKYLKEHLNYVLLKNDFMDKVIGTLSSVIYEKDLTFFRLNNVIKEIKEMVPVSFLENDDANVNFINDLVSWVQEQFDVTFY